MPARNVFAFCCIALLAGCDEMADSDLVLNPAEPPRPVTMDDGSTITPESEDVFPPTISDLPFTIWDAKLTTTAVEFKFRLERVERRASYRLVLTGDSTFQYPLNNPQPTYCSTAKIKFPNITQLGTVQLYVEKQLKDSASARAELVSNAVTLQGPRSPIRTLAAAAPEGKEADEKGPLLGVDVYRAWKAMAKEFGETKVAVVRVIGLPRFKDNTELFEFASAWRKERPGCKTSVITTSDASVVVIGPCEDLQEFADHIKFGQVVSVDSARRTVEVVAQSVAVVEPPVKAKLHVTERDHPDYFRDNLAVMLGRGESRSTFDRQDALNRLKSEDPERCTDQATRAEIARAFKAAATDSKLRFDARDDAIDGLVNWAGVYSVPVLIGILQQTDDASFFEERTTNKIAQILGDFKDPRAIAPLAAILRNTSFHATFRDKRPVATALAKFGPEAEQSLMDIAPINDPQTSLLAIEMLGDVGTPKCLPLLRQALKSRNSDVRERAKLSIRSVNERQAAASQKN